MPAKDIIDEFMTSCCRREIDGSEAFGDLYLAFRGWAVGAGIPLELDLHLGPRLRREGFRRFRNAAGRRCYRGIVLTGTGRAALATWRRCGRVRWLRFMYATGRMG